MEFKNVLPYAISISGTMNGGYLMEVGCSRFAYGDIDDMLELLKAYLDDPEGTVKEYNKALNKHGGSPSALGEVPTQDHECETQAEVPEPEGNVQ